MSQVFLTSHASCEASRPWQRPIDDVYDQDHAAAFVINGRFLKQRVTGVQRYARQIVTHLDGIVRRRGERICLVSPRGSLKTIELQKIKHRQVGRVQGHVWEQFVLPFCGGKPILNLCNTAPVAARQMAVCIHDCNVFEAADSYSGGFRAYYRFLLPRLIRDQTRIVTVSTYSADAIARRFGIPMRQISILPNGFEHVLRWDPQRSKFCYEREQRPYLLLVGSIARHKNVGRILSLADSVAAIGLDIKVVGAPASAFRHANLHEASNIQWLGPVPDDDLAYLIDHALCLVFPSRNEGFGLPVLEAMARGCPVISSNRTSLPEVCGGAALLADPDDGDAWLRHIKRLAASSQLRRELTEKGRQQSLLFSWQASAQGYLELMEPRHG